MRKYPTRYFRINPPPRVRGAHTRARANAQMNQLRKSPILLPAAYFFLCPLTTRQRSQERAPAKAARPRGPVRKKHISVGSEPLAVRCYRQRGSYRDTRHAVAIDMGLSPPLLYETDPAFPRAMTLASCDALRTLKLVGIVDVLRLSRVVDRWLPKLNAP